MTHGNLSIRVTPDKRGMKSVNLYLEVENIEQVMDRLYKGAPAVQVLDLILRVARRR